MPAWVLFVSAACSPCRASFCASCASGHLISNALEVYQPDFTYVFLIDDDLLPLPMLCKFLQPSLLILEPFVILFRELSLSSCLNICPSLHSSVVRLAGIQVSEKSTKQPLATLLIIWHPAPPTRFPAWFLFLCRLRGGLVQRSVAIRIAGQRGFW